jgi:hypothetical protein
MRSFTWYHWTLIVALLVAFVFVFVRAIVRIGAAVREGREKIRRAREAREHRT